MRCDGDIGTKCILKREAGRQRKTCELRVELRIELRVHVGEVRWLYNWSIDDDSSSSYWKASCDDGNRSSTLTDVSHAVDENAAI